VLLYKLDTALIQHKLMLCFCEFSHNVFVSRTAAALLAPVALTSMSPDGYDSLTSNAFMSLCDPSLSPDSLFVQSHRGAAGDTNNVTSDLGPCSDRGDILADQNGL